MADKTWLDYVTATDSIATPLLVLLLTGVGWRIRLRLERRATLESTLREDRIPIYNAILEPYVILLTSDAAWQADPKNRGRDKGELAKRTIVSLDYRKNVFRMSLIAPDSVVRTYNDLMQYSYQSKSDDPDAPKEMMSLVGRFPLEIRKSMGNDTTDLDAWDMLEWFVTDARRLRRSDGAA